LRSRYCDPLELGLGADRRRSLDQGTSSADARPLAPTQPLLEEHLRGELRPIRERRVRRQSSRNATKTPFMPATSGFSTAARSRHSRS
jgi:hypothetical protein